MEVLPYQGRLRGAEVPTLGAMMGHYQERRVFPLYYF